MSPSIAAAEHTSPYGRRPHSWRSGTPAWHGEGGFSHGKHVVSSTHGDDDLFETHALSEDNQRGVASGWEHSRLSERGRRLPRSVMNVAATTASPPCSALTCAGLSRPPRSPPRRGSLRSCSIGVCVSAITATSTAPPRTRTCGIAPATWIGRTRVARAGGRPLPGRHDGSMTYRCDGVGLVSWSWGTSRRVGRWTTISTACPSKHSWRRTSSGRGRLEYQIST